MGAWGDSRALTRQSWAVLKDNRYLLAYPALGAVACIVPFLVVVPGFLFIAADRNWIGWALIILGLYLAMLVTAIFQAGLTVSAAAELEGGRSSLGHGLGMAFGRLGRLARWAFVGTVVNVLIGLLRGNNNGGLVAVIFRSVLAAAADVMWQLITFFVMPAMMLDDLGMIDAIKKSASTFKQRWGTQLSGGVRIGGLIGLVAIVPAVIAIVVGALLATAGAWAVGLPIAVIGFIVLVIAGLILSAIRGVFSVVLYRFATQGVVEGGFTEQQLAGAVKVKA
ncbi:MAG: hypothetical protein RL134_1596 [Actinomycetota bacterium]|jgi:hypothetical protein